MRWGYVCRAWNWFATSKKQWYNICNEYYSLLQNTYISFEHAPQHVLQHALGQTILHTPLIY